jgi:hypothetical protein
LTGLMILIFINLTIWPSRRFRHPCV